MVAAIEYQKKKKPPTRKEKEIFLRKKEGVYQERHKNQSVQGNQTILQTKKKDKPKKKKKNKKQKENLSFCFFLSEQRKNKETHRMTINEPSKICRSKLGLFIEIITKNRESVLQRILHKQLYTDLYNPKIMHKILYFGSLTRINCDSYLLRILKLLCIKSCILRVFRESIESRIASESSGCNQPPFLVRKNLFS